MPKERRMNSSPFNQATISPYSHNLKISDSDNYDSSVPHDGEEKEWEQARCPICMEHPHNAVLLLCSSHGKGCRPFICDTSYRHSNCLDQFRKSSAATASCSQNPLVENESELLCPLCRGIVTGWNVVHPAREYMDSRTRSCSLETCNFSGNYTELRRHARLKHPSKRPSEASPTRQSNWAAMERQRDIEDALAYHSDIDYDWGEESFLSNGSFFDFESGMSDIEDSLIDEMFLGISLSIFSVYSSSEEEMIDSGSSRSTDWPPLPTNPGSTLNTTNQVGNGLISLHGANRANISSLTSGFQREDDAINMQVRSSPRHSYRRENPPTGSRTRWIANDTNISRPRASNSSRENVPGSSRMRSSYRRERVQPSSMARPTYYHREVVPSVRRPVATRPPPRLYRQPHSRYYHSETSPWAGPGSTRHVAGSYRQPHSRSYQPATGTRRMPDSYRRPYSRYHRSTRNLQRSSRQTQSNCEE